MDINQIADSWKNDQPCYEELGRVVSSFIKSTITECEILPEINYRTKELLSIVKKIKKKLREGDYSYSNLNDKLGVRIICSFNSEMKIIDEYLKKYFTIIKPEYKSENLDFNKLDYISNHYDTKIKTSVKQFSKYTHLQDLVFEIQVRTLNQHAWSNAAHSLSYKQEAEILPSLNRKIYRLLSLYEIADDEFSAVNKALIESQGSNVYKLFRKLESKTYKYAQIDFDRESSLFVIDIVLQFLSEEETEIVFKEIDAFIQVNDKKIQRIFDDNRKRFYEIPILTQPEIYFIWFCLEKFPYSLTDNWNTNFINFELDEIKTLWGSQID
jgi:putative GTP pyrophosphokinase